MLGSVGDMKRIVNTAQYEETLSDESIRQSEWLQRARRMASTEEAEDWSFLRMFFRPRSNEPLKAGADEASPT